jgi:hypothetical protein
MDVVEDEKKRSPGSETLEEVPYRVIGTESLVDRGRVVDCLVEHV